MNIIIKGAKGFEIYDKHKDYIEKKFRKFEKRVKEPAKMEFAFHHTHGTRANIDKRIHLTFKMAGMKCAEHIEELTEHFPETIDNLEKRFAKFFRRYKDKTTKTIRRPKRTVATKIKKNKSK